MPQIVPELNSMSKFYHFYKLLIKFSLYETELFIGCGKPSISPSDFEMRIIGGSPAVPNSWFINLTKIDKK